MMRRWTRRACWIIAVGMVLIWALWFWNGDRMVLEDPPSHATLPFGVRENVKLARGWEPLDRGSLRLVCTDKNELRLLLQTLMPDRGLRPPRRDLGPEAYDASLNVPGDVKAVLYVDGRTTHSLSFPQARLESIRSVDTIATTPLSDSELQDLADWMDEARMKRFGFMTLEQGVFMHGFTHGDEIRDLTSRCAARR